MKNEDIINAWEKRVGETTAFLHFDNKYLKKDSVYLEYRKALSGVRLKNKSVIDWGCGGGLFCEWLHNRCDSVNYKGFDISLRGITAAKERNPERNFLKIEPDNFVLLRITAANIFICLSVIQHFPDKIYFDNFFRALNDARNNKLIMQIRYAEITKFADEPYKTTHDINNACWTNAQYLSYLLTNYQLTKESEIAGTGYQYLVFKRKED